MREIIKNNLLCIKDERVALLMSGGVGSALILDVLLELEKDVTLYTFHMKDVISDDLKKSREIALKFKLPLIEIELPNEVDDIKKDCLFLINEIGCSLKTDVECAFPILHSIKGIEENVIVTGLGDDDPFCLTKRGVIYYKTPLDNLNEYRQKCLDDMREQSIKFKKIASLYNKVFLSPYLDNDDYMNYFKLKTWDEINKPKKKQELINNLSECWLGWKFYYANYQKGNSQIASTFEKLLMTDWNVRGYKRTDGIYNSIKRGEIKELLHDNGGIL